MVIEKTSITRFLYFTLILSLYVTGMEITSPAIEGVISKVSYLALGSLFIIQMKKINIIINRSFIPLVLLFGYIVFYLLSIVATQPEGLSLGTLISKSIFYPVIFIVFCGLAYELGFKELLFPFFIGTLMIIALSLLPLMGYEYSYYSLDEARLEKHLIARGKSLQAAGFVRYSGVYINQNAFGLILVVGIGASLALYFDWFERAFKYSRFQLYLIIFTFVASLLFLLVTLSRASILASFVILALVSYKTYKNKRVLTTVLFLALSLIFFFYFNQEVFELAYYRFTEQGTSSRGKIWGEALGEIAKHPFSGVGGFVSTINNKEQTAHNVYLQVLSDNGIVAGLLWVLWLGFYFFNSLRVVILKKLEEEPRMFILSALFISILIHQLFEVHINSALHIATCALMLSMTLSYHLYKNQFEGLSGKSFTSKKISI